MKTRYTQVLPMVRCLMGSCEHSVTVCSINAQYHVRVFVNGQLNQEAVCFSRHDISYTARNMLRDEDKCGNISAYATSARERLNRKPS